MRMKRLFRKRFVRAASVAAIALITVALVLDRWTYPLPTGKLSRPPAHFVYSRDGRLLNSFASSDCFWRKPVALDRISPKLIASVTASEDQWFRWHAGVNPVSLVTAAVDNVRAGRVVRGGSTITMQIARMMEPKERTIGGKLVEMLRALQLELHYSKDDLLDIYFNLVPYGGNIEGVGAATHFYFDKEPDRLSWSEAAILTAIPASPNAFRPDLHPDRCRARRDRVLANLHQLGVIDDAEYRDALAEEIPSRRMNRPFFAPHLSQTALAARPRQTELRTTIDYNLQQLCERLAANYHATLRPKGINNLSVVVIDNRSGDLLAMVGSPDFNDTEHAGQINGALAPRSPGSTLKPFVYALGFENGLITPSSRLDDIPVSFAGYAPENYDEQYHGVVPVSEALIQSFNVPAVNLTAKVGLREFYDLLRAGGLNTLSHRYYQYGLPLVLGACEIPLLDLTNIYAALARGGEYRPVREFTDETLPKDRRILSTESCYLVSEILANLQRPDLPTSWEFTRDLPTVAWKTGTSYGRKDAWTIGYNPRYTVGVWTGNFSGEGSPYIVGAETAAPLMFEVFNALTRGQPPIWYERPPDVRLREVCTVTGQPPSEYCPSTRQDLYIEGVSPAAVCGVHQRIFVDHHTGYRLCRACMRGKAVDTLVMEQWPARLTAWLLGQHAVAELPEQNPDCRGIIVDDAPVIASPEPEAVYELRRGAPREYQKILFKASVAHESKSVHWFLDDELYATCTAGEGVFYLPEAGRHELMALDDLGRSTTIRFEVR